VIDTATNQVVGAPITVGTSPFGIAITPDGTRAYVANNSSATVSVIYTATNQVVGAPIPVGSNPDAVAIVPDQPPQASLRTKAKGRKATLKGGASSDPDGQIAAFGFAFGDGKSAQTTTPATKHTYAKVAEFTAGLTLTDNEGCSTTLVFTGQTASCNGSAVAGASRLLAAVKLGKLKRNTEDGTAKLTVKVPGQGRLKLSGKGVVKQRPAAPDSSLAKAVKGKGRVKLRIKAKGKKKRELNRTGKVKLKVKITFRLTGGDRNIQTKKVKLIKTR
jgi:YVTN family beta-propeller protein